MGYIPHVRAENMFGRTYGNLTQIAKNDPQASKNFAYNQGRMTSTSKDTFFNQNNANKTGGYPTVSIGVFLIFDSLEQGMSKLNMKTSLRSKIYSYENLELNC